MNRQYIGWCHNSMRIWQAKREWSGEHFMKLFVSDFHRQMLKAGDILASDLLRENFSVKITDKMLHETLPWLHWITWVFFSATLYKETIQTGICFCDRYTTDVFWQFYCFLSIIWSYTYWTHIHTWTHNCDQFTANVRVDILIFIET